MHSQLFSFYFIFYYIDPLKAFSFIRPPVKRFAITALNDHNQLAVLHIRGQRMLTF